MNTPTPAQALGEVLATLAPMIGKKRFTAIKYDDGTSAMEGDNDYMVAVYMCLDLVITHGQHFAGLEAEAENARETLAKALDAGGVNDDPLRKLASRASNALYWREQANQESEARAEAAEARCAEIEAKYYDAVTKYAGAVERYINALGSRDEWHAKAKTAEARALEAEGLLRDIDSVSYDRIAAFLAARG